MHRVQTLRSLAQRPHYKQRVAKVLRVKYPKAVKSTRCQPAVCGYVQVGNKRVLVCNARFDPWSVERSTALTWRWKCSLNPNTVHEHQVEERERKYCLWN